jgi:hypothetical protein
MLGANAYQFWRWLDMEVSGCRLVGASGEPHQMEDRREHDRDNQIDDQRVERRIAGNRV